jgi:hypothetical protein
MSYRLDSAVIYGMDQIETKAYYLCLVWLDLSRHYFPKYNHFKIKQGDPRKSTLFKYCYTLIRNTWGKLPESDYYLYVKAQLVILKAIGEKENVYVRVEPNCLVGQKAWKRWKVFKKKYDAKLKFIDVKIETPEDVVKESLVRSHAFLKKHLPEFTFDKFQELNHNQIVLKWIILGQISQYYALACPFIKQFISEEELAKKLNYDLSVYKNSLNENILKWFDEKIWSNISTF